MPAVSAKPLQRQHHLVTTKIQDYSRGKGLQYAKFLFALKAHLVPKKVLILLCSLPLGQAFAPPSVAHSMHSSDFAPVDLRREMVPFAFDRINHVTPSGREYSTYKYRESGFTCRSMSKAYAYLLISDPLRVEDFWSREWQVLASIPLCNLVGEDSFVQSCREGFVFAIL